MFQGKIINEKNVDICYVIFRDHTVNGETGRAAEGTGRGRFYGRRGTPGKGIHTSSAAPRRGASRLVAIYFQECCVALFIQFTRNMAFVKIWENLKVPGCSINGQMIILYKTPSRQV